MTGVSAAFRLLRKQGLDARSHFKCCSSCAGSAIAYEYGEKAAKDPDFEPKGLVFFHQQDADRTKERAANPNPEKPVTLMIRYTQVSYTLARKRPLKNPKYRRSAWSRAKIARAIVVALRKAKVAYDWSNDTDQTITVFPLGR